MSERSGVVVVIVSLVAEIIVLCGSSSSLFQRIPRPRCYILVLCGVSGCMHEIACAALLCEALYIHRYSCVWDFRSTRSTESMSEPQKI